MKKLAFFLLSTAILFSCGTSKGLRADVESEKTFNLPPDVGSNKYSKKKSLKISVLIFHFKKLK